MSQRKKAKTETRLIVAASDHDPDMLYATRFFVPDPFIFLEQNGKRTHRPERSGDRSRAETGAGGRDSFPYSAFEREVQGNAKESAAFRKGHVALSAETRRALRACAGEFSARLRAGVGAPQDPSLRTTNGLFWPEREAKSDEELTLDAPRACRSPRSGLARAMEVLAASKAGPGRSCRLVGADSDFGNPARRNRLGDPARGRVAGEHDRGRRRSGVRSA